MEIYIYIDREKIKANLVFGDLFQGDRWAPFPQLVESFFCDEKIMDELDIKGESFYIKTVYLKNYRTLVEVNCN
jgi:hypothetical protein